MNACLSSSSSQSVKISSNWSTMTARPGGLILPANCAQRPGSARSVASAASASSGTSCSASVRSGRDPGLKSSNRRPPAPARERPRARSAGISPARNKDDLPAPEGPTTTSGMLRATLALAVLALAVLALAVLALLDPPTPALALPAVLPASPARSAARSTSSRVRSSRPKNHWASSGVKLARPR